MEYCRGSTPRRQVQVAYCPYDDSGAGAAKGRMFSFPRVRREMLVAETRRMHAARQAKLQNALPDTQAPLLAGTLGSRKKAVVVRVSPPPPTNPSPTCNHREWRELPGDHNLRLLPEPALWCQLSSGRCMLCDRAEPHTRPSPKSDAHTARPGCCTDAGQVAPP